jgi:phosphoglucomutase
MSGPIAQPSAILPVPGRPAPKEMLVDLARIEQQYCDREAELADPNQLVSFGTSGHRGFPLRGSFNEAHVLAIVQAICDYRSAEGIDGPLYLGKDTHALSGPAQRTALEVLAANGVETVIQRHDGVTPTPAISRAIFAYNQARRQHLADGIVITPSRNPREDGGVKYNPTNGAPADTSVTRWVENRANKLLRQRNASVKRVPFAKAITASSTHKQDLVMPYLFDGPRSAEPPRNHGMLSANLRARATFEPKIPLAETCILASASTPWQRL